MAFATARRRWPPPAAGTWRGWRPFAVCLPMRWRDSIASSSPPRGRSPSTPWESINPPAAATNVTPSSTSIWPAGVWPPRMRPLFADRSTQRHGRPRSRRAGDDAGGTHGFCARRSAAAGPLLGDGTAGADPRADRRGAVCRHWPRRGQSGLDHGYQPGGVAP